MRLLSILVLSGLAACVTPSIPIPPPDPTQIDATITVTGPDSTMTLTYPARHEYVGGVSTVFNDTTGHGTVDRVNADGSVGPTTPIPAQAGDQIIFSVENSKQTVSICFVLRSGTQDPNVYCQ